MSSHLNNQLIQFLEECEILTFDDDSQTYNYIFNTVQYQLESDVFTLLVNAIVENWVKEGILDMCQFQNTFSMSLDAVVAMVRELVLQWLEVLLRSNIYSYGRENV
ncbi:hypothetical protein L211DRAFT_340665 [Terfezia boudieri ATCC MYA-4762]|uniref:Uncharacterized protein n=1 Tax=Terfezia boudieri ATCC MYA-4762 TaxID=1051890 RepID=A0A3N4LH36_9PEZI|nr:hypothetical protein L211DRAFT_340665 [Terfezia boudieri ATCC MYA-4762]